MDPVEKLRELEKRVDAYDEKNQALEQQVNELKTALEAERLLHDRRLKQAEELQAKMAEMEKDVEVGRKFRELLSTVVPSSTPPLPGSAGQVDLSKTEWVVNVQKQQREAKADDTTCRGRILVLGSEGFFDQPKLIGNITERLTQVYGSQDTTQQVLQALVELSQEGLLAREQQSNKQWRYFRPTSVIYKN